MPLLPVLLSLLSVPVLELWLLIKVGGYIGPGWTVALVTATAVVGAVLVRIQGFAVIGRVRAALARGQLPASELLEGAALLVAGAMLLLPGFVTDILGFCAFVPSWRRAFARQLLRRTILRSSTPRRDPPRRPRTTAGRVFDGEARRLEDD